MAGTEYGQKISQAYRAIIRMQQDTKKLLLDCDSFFKNGESIFENTVTGGLSYSINASCWMASTVFRFWQIDGQEHIPAVTIIFFPEGESDEQHEPLFVAGKINYNVEDSEEELKNIVNRWELWYAVKRWVEKVDFSQAQLLNSPDDEGRIDRLHFIVKPLFSIRSFEDVEDVFKSLEK